MLKVLSAIGLLLVLSLWVSVAYVTVNRAVVYVSYSSMKCVETSSTETTCSDFYKNRDEFLIEYI